MVQPWRKKLGSGRSAPDAARHDVSLSRRNTRLVADQDSAQVTLEIPAPKLRKTASTFGGLMLRFGKLVPKLAEWEGVIANWWRRVKLCDDGRRTSKAVIGFHPPAEPGLG